MNKATIEWLRKLLEEKSIVYSQTGKSTKTAIQSLLDCEVIAYEPKGNGGRYVLKDEEALTKMLDSMYPDLSAEFVASPRAEAARRFRNTKLAKLDTPTIIHIRSVGDDVWRNKQKLLDIATLTKSFGIASLCITEDDNWTTDTPVGLIENKEPFFNCSEFFGTTLCTQFIYYKGWMNGKFIEWLRNKKRAPKVIVFADYDPVGLQNYLKLRQSIGDSACLAVPSNIETLIKKYGNADILSKNTALIPKLLNSNEPGIINLVKIMQKYGCGLEQELCSNLDLIEI